MARNFLPDPRRKATQSPAPHLRRNHKGTSGALTPAPLTGSTKSAREAVLSQMYCPPPLHFPIRPFRRAIRCSSLRYKGPGPSLASPMPAQTDAIPFPDVREGSPGRCHAQKARPHGPSHPCAKLSPPSRPRAYNKQRSPSTYQ